MIQSYDQIKKQAIEINEALDGQAYIQKIYSSAYYICLTIRLAGVTKFLYLGRGAGKEGLWLGDKRVESILRKRDKLLEYLRRHVGSSSFLRFEMDEKDRVFTLVYQKWGRENKFSMFYNARNLYFMNWYYSDKHQCMMLFKSWGKKPELISNYSIDLFDEVGRVDLERKESLNLKIVGIDKLLADEKKQAIVGNYEGKSKKFYKRKFKNISGDLERVKTWGNLLDMVESENDFSSYPMKNKFNGVKLNFQYPDHYKRRDQVYEKIKKLKKAEGILNLRLKDTENHLNKYQDDILENKLKPVSPVWYKASAKAQPIKNVAEKGYTILKFENFDLAIGSTAHGNDQMRKEWAKKSDYWFHLDGDKSPHIIVKLGSAVLDQENLGLIAGVMIWKSSLNYSEANLIYTPVKNLKGVKGVPGKVIYKKEKHIKIQVNDNWRDALLSELLD